MPSSACRVQVVIALLGATATTPAQCADTVSMWRRRSSSCVELLEVPVIWLNAETSVPISFAFAGDMDIPVAVRNPRSSASC
jgi:hypothetical protein